MSHLVPNKGRIAVLAFGTLGDVLPLAAVAAALGKSKPHHEITFITHVAHQFLRRPLSTAGVLFYGISTAPVAVPPDNAFRDKSPLPVEAGSPSAISAEGGWKVHVEQKHRQECLFAVEHVFGEQPDEKRNFIIFNFFALEGWHLAELYCVPCAVAAPYVIPYSAPASFEKDFITVQPLLYKRLQQSKPGEVGWDEVMHWMWPLFTTRWTKWRSDSLHLSAVPLTDPVTELPILQKWPQAPPLLYGVSQEVVECPAYWPTSLHLCGFWFAPAEWDAMYDQHGSAGIPNKISDPSKEPAAPSSSALQCNISEFLSGRAGENELPIFFGLSSAGSMGYVSNPENLLRVIQEMVVATSTTALLSTSSYIPLDTIVLAAAIDQGLPSRNVDANLRLLKDGISLGSRIFCFSGFVPYNWLFPNCSVVVHHGGSGTTAAALWSGVPQIICPFALDQFYWGNRLAWIGVAPEPLKACHLFPSDGQEFLEATRAVINAVSLASTVAIRTSAATLSQKIRQEDGKRRFFQIISEYLHC